MTKLIDYKCRYASFSGISKEFAESAGLTLPEAHLHADSIAKLAMAVADRDGSKVCVLPQDPVVEAEALGGKIKYDESNLGPRKDTDIIATAEDIAALPRFDVSSGRIAEILRAVSVIKENGRPAAIEIHGPFSIFNGLGDSMKILMAWRKKPDVMKDVMDKLKDDLVIYAVAARNAGCDILYYSDSAGGLNIIGPKFAAQLTEWFTVPFLKALDDALDESCIVHMCPKTSFMLTGLEKAVWKPVDVPAGCKTYVDACLALSGKVRFMGQKCRKDENTRAGEKLWYLDLL